MNLKLLFTTIGLLLTCYTSTAQSNDASGKYPETMIIKLVEISPNPLNPATVESKMIIVNSDNRTTIILQKN